MGPLLRYPTPGLVDGRLISTPTPSKSKNFFRYSISKNGRQKFFGPKLFPLQNFQLHTATDRSLQSNQKLSAHYTASGLMTPTQADCIGFAAGVNHLCMILILYRKLGPFRVIGFDVFGVYITLLIDIDYRHCFMTAPEHINHLLGRKTTGP